MTTALITIPRRRSVLNLRFIGWVFAIFRESFAHQQVIYRRCVQNFLEHVYESTWAIFEEAAKKKKRKRKKCGATRAENSK